MTPLEVMRSITGTKAGGDNPVIMAWPAAIAARWPEMSEYAHSYTHDTISWCGLTVAYCLTRAGIRPPFGPQDTDKFLWALSYRNFGADAGRSPEPGDILVFIWGSGGHHVTLYEGPGSKPGHWKCRGGNQSHEVDVQEYPYASCVAVRRPVGIALPSPTPSPPPAPSPSSPPALPPAIGLPPLLELGEEAAALAIRQWIHKKQAETTAIADLRDMAAMVIDQLQAFTKAADAFLQSPSSTPAPTPPTTPPPTPAPPKSFIPTWLQPSPTPAPSPSPTPPPTPTPAPTPAPTSPKFMSIYATCFGGSADPQHSAYDGHLITDTELACSLPGFHKGFVAIEFPDTGKVVIAANADKGPWNTRDQYWLKGVRPLAESQYANKTRAQDGEIPSNPAGIDLSPGTVLAGGGAQTLSETKHWSGRVNFWFPEGSAPVAQGSVMNAVTQNPVTSSIGGVSLLAAVASGVIAWQTKDPTALGVAVTTLITGLLGLFSRDGHK